MPRWKKNKRIDPKAQVSLSGVVKRHPDGFGFLLCDSVDHPDVYISKRNMIGVMTNDRVEAEVRAEVGGDRYRGRILRILSRAHTSATGQFHQLSDRQGILRDESHGWGEDLRVNLDNGIQPKDGDWVHVEILDYPGSEKGFRGKLKAIIGDGFDPLNDDRRVLYSQGIPQEFSSRCLKEADQLPDEVHPEAWRDRKDLRALPFITIDGATAKDFDDAICVEMTDEGFHLYVAIADVSHYVKSDSAIDDEALERGNSTYFPHLVIPMLPEKLSNGLCSLRPHVPRLAFVAEIWLDFQGESHRSEFYEAVIESQARLTYGEAQEILDGATPPEFAAVEATVKRAEDLAKVLMARRYQRGSLNLEIPETEIEVDEAGEPVDIIKAERLFSHKLIEELMLAANVAVAEFFHAREIPALYRIHESPDPESIHLLQSFLEAFGFKRKLSRGSLQKQLSRALQKFAGTPQEHILSLLTLRSMNQAKYSAENMGHFGLGFANYTHFTSPIRRYPDLIVHRLLKSQLSGPKGYALLSTEKLETLGTQLSATEQRSVKAERQLNAIKKARFIRRHLGEQFEGMISSVTKFGIFVILRQFDVDGLVRVEELGNEYFEFDPEHLRLRGRKSGREFCIGDTVTIQVAAANVDEGRIDFVLVEESNDGSLS